MREEHNGLWEIRKIFAQIPLPASHFAVKLVCKEPPFSTEYVEFELTEYNIEEIKKIISKEKNYIRLFDSLSDVYFDLSEDGYFQLSCRKGIFKLDTKDLEKIERLTYPVLYHKE